MNPELTYTLPVYQVACGVTDIMMHTLDRYFNPLDNELTDSIAEALLRTVIAKGSVAIKDTLDYDAMSELMWAGSLSHNGLTGLGGREDFAVHQLGHELSAMFDTAHGASLATVWGSWALAVYDAKPGRFARYAKNVWGLDGDDEETLALAGIQATVDYFRSLGMPVSFGDNKDIGIQEDTVLRDLAFRCKMCIRDRYIIFLSSSLVSVKYQADRIALPVKKYAVIPVKFPIQILIRDRSGQSFNINLFRGILTDIELPFVKRLIHPVVTVLIEHNRTAIFMLPVIIHRRIWAFIQRIKAFLPVLQRLCLSSQLIEYQRYPVPIGQIARCLNSLRKYRVHLIIFPTVLYSTRLQLK